MFTDVHDPVMVARIVELLGPSLQRPDAVLVDCTLGLAGHALAILRAAPGARLIGIDRDRDALEVAGQRLAGFSDRVTLVQAVHDEIGDVLAELGLSRVDAILADLGLSSLQIDREDRGFAYRVDAPLDMRMDQSHGVTAAEVLNTFSAAELTSVLRRYGEERFARQIATAIVTEREHRPLTTSAQLVGVVDRAIPAAVRHRQGGHPAKRTFQALRIEVNDELQGLGRFLPAALRALGVGGRIAVLAYHSLEDRQVKQAFAAHATDRAPRDMPVVPDALRAEFQLLTRGAEKPDAQEIETNPRAASARLRAAQRIKEAA
ncbi:16S rRNA (cytosine(1402)-N(4))-methyltransferase RsmH [Arachnia propionica]|uniref:Ribosomal RNA small subunit methyltransferase H n=1 Tax=Arachnia propionica TaxID=1750 RepID=A0A3P1T6L0_9ACTN|nr:16S rRNA (cytosine(1402)-N(4))-methyltransferase RsmH [Arachnia propionica]MDO5083511.1 16S rRNA (cytosine(1402)-N(4))-methyltransferase RsmH [Arachnia propionica]RRD04938.1 16S rRNA (cytosine(1402)-N(4))-methyltransferase RsmH [Arachnia propionica]